MAEIEAGQKVARAMWHRRVPGSPTRATVPRAMAKVTISNADAAADVATVSGTGSASAAATASSRLAMVRDDSQPSSKRFGVAMEAMGRSRSRIAAATGSST